MADQNGREGRGPSRQNETGGRKATRSPDAGKAIARADGHGTVPVYRCERFSGLPAAKAAGIAASLAALGARVCWKASDPNRFDAVAPHELVHAALAVAQERNDWRQMERIVSPGRARGK